MRKRMLCVCCAALLATAASATLVTDTSTFPAGFLVIDFSQFTGGNQYTGVNGPVQVGGLVGADVQFTSTNSNGWLYDGNWGLAANGNWDSGRNGYAGANAPSGDPMVFTFAMPVSAVGGFMNYAPGYGSVTFEALGAGSVVLESYDLTSAAPIATSTADDGAFRGIVRASPDIVALRVTGAYPVLDNLSFAAAAPIPAASKVGLLVLGLLLAAAGVVALRLRA